MNTVRVKHRNHIVAMSRHTGRKGFMFFSGLGILREGERHGHSEALSRSSVENRVVVPRRFYFLRAIHPQRG